MAKVTATEIIDMGFTPEMFNKATVLDLTTYVDSVITEMSSLLSARLGTTIYGSTTSPKMDYVKRAEKCLVAGELWDRRVDVVLSNIVTIGRALTSPNESTQRDHYLTEAETWITRALAP